VATVSQALIEEAQSRTQMGLWNNIGTLIASLEQDWRRRPSVSMFGLDPRDDEHKSIHVHIMEVMQDASVEGQDASVRAVRISTV
jgi:hypothetical protein